jgi:hypothetical protein
MIQQLAQTSDKLAGISVGVRRFIALHFFLLLFLLFVVG